MELVLLVRVKQGKDLQESWFLWRLNKQKQEKEQEGDGGDEEGSNSGGAEETEQIAVDDFDPEKVLEHLKALESLSLAARSNPLSA